MSLADDIRNFVIAHYVAPARGAGQQDLQVRAGDVHRDMQLKNRMPAVCGALRSQLFAQSADVRLIRQDGPAQGANAVFFYRLGDGRTSLEVAQPAAVPADRLSPVSGKQAQSAEGTVYLVSCVGKKRSAPAPAKDLYTSEWFRRARRYVEASGRPWFILSAEHGLIAPDDIIAPYEKTLNNMGVAERRAWASRVKQQLTECRPKIDRVVIFAGQRYREFLTDYFRDRSIDLEVPLKGLRIGEQLSWFGHHSP
jgi:hypothetical protein